MSLTFERPCGAAMDVRELEYITALHQTQHNDEQGFRDGSIEGKLSLLWAWVEVFPM